ncbi:MAG: FlgD immunoglobulin-like domain containing protein, partial [Legionella sp.]|uniref:FlgD immunoglobulin-like domain containing protein n=1 Tax=Legionella sp. TaxID=459 RepID=UPI0028446F4C|nr:FlgD immunoglobulin-like domain containing protein [Legionella sp.]
RAKINFNGTYSNWTVSRAFIIENIPHNGYYMEGKQLNSFNLDNVFYKDSLGGLILNSSFLPAKPSNNKLLDTFSVSLPADLSGQTSITTDGKYIFSASIAFYQANNKSKIYKIGSGNSGTIKGFNYGEIPGVEVSIWHTMFYYKDGFIYAATGDHHSLLKINPDSGDTSRVIIPAGLLNEASQVADGAFFLTSDGNYVYNLAYHDSSVQNFKYILRKFDPVNGWTQIGADDTLSGTSYPNFCGFFVTPGYLYPYEHYYSGFMRRINLQSNIFEEEWITYNPFQSFYAWTYDWTNNEVYTSVFGSGKIPRIFKFIGKYKQSTGTVVTPTIGPASKWKNITFTTKIQNTSTSLVASLYGLNINSNKWDTLLTYLNSNTSLNNFSSDVYPYMKMQFSFQDTTFNSFNPNILKNVNIDYLSLPELYLDKPSFYFNPDTLLQGLSTIMNVGVHNGGYITADTVSINFYLDNSDSSFYKTRISNITTDSTKTLSYVIPTTSLSPVLHTVKALIDYNKPEFFKFNNTLNQSFLVSRDSIKPTFDVTFDGKEIINGDVVSSKPVIMITVKDNSPLSLDTTMFVLGFNNAPLYFNRQDIDYKIIPYPNSQMTIKFSPILNDGTDTLDILAKDASGNPIDSVEHKYIFNVFTQPDLINVYNYPNPFKNDTYFTFELHGAQSPEEFKIKIFTVAGRLIRDISIPSESLRIGFNKIYWDGKDQDGDEVANGVYFYKIIAKNNGVVKTTIEKLARVR